MKSLRVYFEKHLVGILSRTEELTLAFSYEDSWQKSEKSFALSLAMPLQIKEYGNKITLSFFENLLPEGEVLESLERTHKLKGPFEFLRKFGRDCARYAAFGITSIMPSPVLCRVGSEARPRSLVILSHT